MQVVNITLNATRFTEANLDRQHRKALPFTVTPLHAGCADGKLGYRRVWAPEGQRRFGGEDGIKLGTAITLSGAAASPNMGYHSSPGVTLLLTLFNLRLGRWQGNPGKAGSKTYFEKGPPWELRPLLSEGLSRVDTEEKWVYLSDGGHFDNLGLYEMVRRRCKVIVVADASADPRYAYDDLARTLQAIRTDFGIRIEVLGHAGCTDERADASHDKVRSKYLMRRGEEHATKDPWLGVPTRVILARICYGGNETAPDDAGAGGRGAAAAVGGGRDSQGPDFNKGDGILIYLKPIVCPNDPVELVNRKLRSKAFPHDSTLHQLFDERTFESYRLLGQHTVAWLLEGQDVPGGKGVEESGGRSHPVRLPDGSEIDIADTGLAHLCQEAIRRCSSESEVHAGGPGRTASKASAAKRPARRGRAEEN